MAERRVLDTLKQIREREAELYSQEVVLCQQKYRKIEQQTASLLAYRQEYRQITQQRYSAQPDLYRDRQLFLQRLDETINASQRCLFEANQSVEKAIYRLQTQLTKTASLGAAIEQQAIQQQYTERQSEQKQCDEQNRMTTVNRNQTQAFD